MKRIIDKKIAVIGAGFVGLAHSLFLANEYAEVILFDRNELLIKDLKDENFMLEKKATALQKFYQLNSSKCKKLESELHQSGQVNDELTKDLELKTV